MSITCFLCKNVWIQHSDWQLCDGLTLSKEQVLICVSFNLLILLGLSKHTMIVLCLQYVILANKRLKWTFF